MVWSDFVALLALLSLTACATQAPPANTVRSTPARENILACTGLPTRGDKCGFGLPRVEIPLPLQYVSETLQDQASTVN
jgi:hypothetical protein